MEFTNPKRPYGYNPTEYRENTVSSSANFGIFLPLNKEL
jgi:hypothetical protein